jgi:uncharacterized protein (TIGR02145 family)
MKNFVFILVFLFMGVFTLRAQTSTYCTAMSNVCDEYISSVTTVGFSNSSSCGLVDGYSDYSSFQIPMTTGQPVTLTITNGSSLWPDDVCGIWIDWNQDYSFDTVTEVILYQVGTGPYSVQINSPAGVLAGLYRIRIRISYQGTMPCGFLNYGETEDYTINLTSGSPAFICGTSTISDYDGNTYNTVLIGTQCWMSENLKSIHYSDGTSIGSGVSAYDNNEANATTYGRLYTWPAVMNGSSGGNNIPSGIQGVCPSGWHMPGHSEFDVLFNYLGGMSVAGGTMKETGYDHWNEPNTGANNSSGFTALGAGGRSTDGYLVGTFSGLGTKANFWSTTPVPGYPNSEVPFGVSSCIHLYNDAASVLHDADATMHSYSVRCVRDETGSGSTGYLYGPSVSTLAVSNITTTGAISGGDITDQGSFPVTGRGACWNTTSNPTIADDHTTDGSGTGIFSSTITGLTPGTAYFVRAYATNSLGTSYGQPVQFTTLMPLNIANVPLNYPHSMFFFNNFGGSQYSSGNYTINLMHPDTMEFVNSIPGQTYLIAGTWGNGIYYASEVIYGTYDCNLVTVDPQTRLRTTIGNLGEYLNGLAYDVTSQTLYGIDEHSLYSISTQTATKTFIGSVGLDKMLVNLACDITGQLYCLDLVEDSIGLIDKQNGQWTPLSSVGFDANFAQDMEFDLATGTLYWAARDWLATGWLSTLDPSTGITTVINDYTDDMYPGGVVIPYGTHDPTCYGVNDGQIFINVSGGETPYQFLWSNGATTQNLSNLTGGTYSVTVTDYSGSSAAAAFTLEAPSAINITTLVDENHCHDFSNAIITLIVSGGMTPYTYLWDNGSTQQFIENATPGIYNATVTDAGNCQSDIGIWLANPDSIIFDYDITDVTCNGAADGAIDLDVSGGYPDYYYEWSNGVTSQDISGLTGGAYEVYITDANSCTVTANITISEPPELTALPLYLTNPGIAYIFNDDPCDVLYGSYYFNLDYPGSLNLIAEQTGEPWLLAGTWIDGTWYAIEAPDYYTSNLVTVNPANGARTVIGNLGVWINGLAWDITTQTLFGVSTESGYQSYLYSIDPYNAVKTLIGQIGVYSLPINLACDLNGQLYSVDLISSYFGNINKNTAEWTDIGWVGFTPNYLQDMEFDHKTSQLYWGSIGDNLPNTLRIIDITTGSSTVVGDFPACANMGGLAIPYGSHGPSCNNSSDGQVFVDISGGTLPYSYLWSNGATTAFLDNVAAGIYLCTVTDANGCIATTSVIIDVPAQMTVSVTATTINTYGGTSTITITASGGTSPYSGTGTFTVPAGTYTYTVTDANGCTAAASVTITQPLPLEVESVPLANPGVAYGFACSTVNLTQGSCSFSLNNPGDISTLSANSTFITGGTYIYGKWYVSEGNPGGRIYSADPVTGSFDTIGNPDLWLTALSFDITTNTLYAISWGNGYLFYLYTLDKNDATPTLIGQISNNAITVTLACSKDGHLYSIDAGTGMFGEINKSTAAWTPIGPTGINPFYQQDMEFDFSSNTLYWASYQYEFYSGALRTINTSTGASTLIGPFEEGAEISGFTIPYGTHGPYCAGGNNGEIYLNVTGGIEPYQFIWSNGATTRNPANLVAGYYSVTVTDAAGNTVTADVVLTSPNPVVADVTASDVLCNGDTSQVTVLASGGVQPYSGTGTFYATAGTYTYTINDANGCTAVTSIIITEPELLVVSLVTPEIQCHGGTSTISLIPDGGTPPFYGAGNFTVTAGTYSYTITDANGCTFETTVTLTDPDQLSVSVNIPDILCNGGTTTISVNANGGVPPYTGTGNYTLSAGTYSYSVTDGLGCSITTSVSVSEPQAVSTIITSQNATCPTCSDGSAAVAVNGGTLPFTFLWSTGASGSSISNLLPGIYHLTVTDSNGCFAYETATITGGQSQQIIILPQGWSMFSTYIIPDNSSVETVLISIISQVIIVKNNNGDVYWPDYNVNQIINLIIGQGYQIKMTSNQNLTVSGTIVVPENLPINIATGWNIIGYLRTSSASIQSVFSNIVSNIIIVKNGGGQVYWPPYSVDQIIEMNPGEGYQVKSNSGCMLLYPANSLSSCKSEIIIQQPEHFGRPVNTGNNMTLGLTGYSLEINAGEIGVFGKDGLLVGSGILDKEFTAVTIWGDDEMTPEKDGLQDNEMFIIKFWNPVTDAEQFVIADYWIEGDGIYKTDGLSVAGIFNENNTGSESVNLYQNVPNPFSRNTSISFDIPEKMKIELTVFNIKGEKVQTLLSGEVQAGRYKIEIDGACYPAGIYLYSLETEYGCVVRKMSVH